MIRFLLIFGFLIIFLIFSMPVLLVYSLIGRKNRERYDYLCFVTIRWAIRVALSLTGAKITVIGKENIAADGAALYVGNHRSLFDIFVHYSLIDEPVSIIAKNQLAKVPLLNLWMKAIGCFFLDRDNIKEGLKMVVQAIDKVKSGRDVLIYPEGTRGHVEGEVLPFKGGSFKIAEKSGCDIVPITIINSAEIFENHRPFVKKTKVIIIYGEHISVKGLSREEVKALPDEVREQILETYYKYKEAI